jgi:hypothetical protein
MTTSISKQGFDPASGREELRVARTKCNSGYLERFAQIFEGGEWYESDVTRFCSWHLSVDM